MKKQQVGLLVIVVVVTVVVTLLFTGLLPQLTKRAYRNGEISQQVKKKLHSLNDQVLTSLINNDFQKFYSLSTSEFERELKEELAPTGDPFARLQKIIKDYEFTEYEEYYITLYQLRDNEQLKIKVNSRLSDQPVVLKLNSVSSKMYVSLLTSGGQSIGHLLGLVYTKQDGGWRLSDLNCRDYAYQGQTAVDYYAQAQKLTQQGATVAAYLYTSVVNKLTPPSNFLHYSQQAEFNQLHRELSKKIGQELPYPIKVESIATQPEIFRLGVKNLEQGLTAVIKYETRISLEETNKLEQESAQLTEKIGEILPGIKDNFNYLAYQIYSKQEADKNYYGIVVDLK